jgi:bifunctional non-homologous end joining protein LigD
LQGDAAAILTNACKLGLEGIVSKRIDKPYRSGRRVEWLKAKCLLSDEFVVAGYLESSSMANAIGALALGVYEDQRLVYVGRVGTGFSHKAASTLWHMLQPLRVTETPLARKLAAPQAKGVVWTRPQLVAQIEYRARTSDGIIRHAVFKAVRNDEPAR